MMEDVIPGGQVLGQVRLGWWRDDPREALWEAWRKNLVLYDWATLATSAFRGPAYGPPRYINGMYIEFENNAGAAVTPPTPTRSEGLSYYTGLVGHAQRDYLRVLAPVSEVGQTTRPSDNLTVHAYNDGIVGVNGKAFSSAQQSRVYGAGLVSILDINDASKDVVVSRFYLTTAGDQLIKPANSNICANWRLTFE